MLTEAQIEIVDESGHVEDRVRIVGTGEVALATRGTSRLELLSDDPTDVDAVISLREGAVTIEAKRQQALRVDDEFLPLARPRGVPQQVVAFIAAAKRLLRVRTVVDRTASLMGSQGAVIRDQPSKLVRWASASAERGAVQVSEQLARLRARGLIDDQGKLLVPFPEDMSPGSKTDV